jgi:hypothetical protein
VQDREFPPKHLRNYNNYLTAVLDGKTDCMYNFKFKDGATSQITTDREHEEVRLQPADKPVKRIVTWYHSSNAYLYGFQLFDKDNVMLFESAWKGAFNGYKS